ncbi:MAG TPA: SEC-C domain-containing protein, partial [Thermoanaerobaculia bacterium]|nr:SEC-C domain-containing protein [Thermoanaerobaculia bacterium]
CGSGKKYKKCCLAKEKAERAEAARPAPSDAPVETALRWLRKHYREEVEAAIAGYFALGDVDDSDELRTLPEKVFQMATVNAYEWLLGDATFLLDGREVPVRELLLGPGGPRFDAEERAWMEAFAARPLGLYEITDTVPGERFRVQDLLYPEEPPVWVHDRAASISLVRWDVVGARLVPWEGGWRASGAVYPFVREATMASFVRSIRDELEDEAGGDPELEREVLAFLIPEEWLLEILEPPPELPNLTDVATGDPILLVTDHYRVQDWRRLEEALAGRDDVEGDRQDGWTRLEPMGVDVWRGILTLNPGRGDRLEAFARTRRRADEGRRWLEELAGDAIEHRTREITDPKGYFAASGGPAGSGGGRPGRGPEPSGRGEPPPMTTELIEQVLRTQYRTWADDKIPALGNKTPRQAVKTREGREDVIGLLKLYEQGEERAAREEGRDPASFRFLWEAVGLDREEALG